MTQNDDLLIPPFDTKVAVAVRDDLEVWQRLNVTAFLASGVAAAFPQLVGQPYVDADGQDYLPILGMPVLVFEGSAESLALARERAVRREMAIAVYSAGMFRTGHDADNRAVVAALTGPELDLVGLAVHGPRNGVDKVLKGLRLHP